MSLPIYASSLISAVSMSQQDLDTPQFIIGGRNASTYKLFKKTTSYVFSNWRSPVYKIGKPFNILEIKIPVHPAITTDMTITPVLYFDNEQTTATGTVINSTNYSNSERLIVLKGSNFSHANGERNFFLELQFSGTVLVTIVLPIKIEIEVDDI